MENILIIRGVHVPWSRSLSDFIGVNLCEGKFRSVFWGATIEGFILGNIVETTPIGEDDNTARFFPDNSLESDLKVVSCILESFPDFFTPTEVLEMKIMTFVLEV